METNTLRSRMVTTATLVLVCLGGAGLAVAADRQQNPVQRPEVSWAADQAAQQWIDAIAAELTTIDATASDTSKAGREALGELQALAIDKARAALGTGAEASAETEAALARLASAQADANAHIERWRLSPTTAELLSRLDTAAQAARSVPGYWSRIDNRAQAVAALVDELARHDALVFRATTAGRQGNWADALASLSEAEQPLAAAKAARDGLAAGGNVDTLSDLIGRYEEYDIALRALYTYVGDTGQQSGEAFDQLQGAVERAQQALPGDNRALSVIVAEAAGTEITDALVGLEQARGDIIDALDAARGEPPAEAPPTAEPAGPSQ